MYLHNNDLFLKAVQFTYASVEIVSEHFFNHCSISDRQWTNADDAQKSNE